MRNWICGGFQTTPTLCYLLTYQGAFPETNFASLALRFSSAPINWEIKRVSSGIKELLRQMENWKRTWKSTRKRTWNSPLITLDTMMIKGLFLPWKAEFFSSLLRRKAKAVKQWVSKPGMKCHHKNTAQLCTDKQKENTSDHRCVWQGGDCFCTAEKSN